MISFLKTYHNWIQNITNWIGESVAWLASVLVVLVCADVTIRYVFKNSSATLVELEWHIFALLFLLAAAYTLSADKHVRVDVFYTRFSAKQKAWVNLFGTAFFLIPFCIIVVKAAIPYIAASYQMDEGSLDPGGLPMRYLIKGAIIPGFSMLFLQGTGLLAQSLHTIFSKNENETDKNRAS